MLQTILSSFLLVALSEMGDKTQLLALSLAARFKKPWPVMGGILVATLLNHSLASYAGNWISSVFHPDLLRYLLGVSFIVFGLWTLFPDAMVKKEEASDAGAFLTAAFLFFLAEMGDKTQLVTVALSARYHSVFSVTAGTTLGMLASDSLAVFLGEKLAEKFPMVWIRRVAAALFFLFGLFRLFRL